MQLSSEDANSFMVAKSREARGIYHECYGEGCDFEEVEEVFGSSQRAVCFPFFFHTMRAYFVWTYFHNNNVKIWQLNELSVCEMQEIKDFLEPKCDVYTQHK